ncbi:ABC transporter ATP-binding protein [Anaeromicropila populeti]|uniref:ATP-binding cassette, subfamily B n=1 Tax=Anaeromicropila populeti TaxID=37658 RepID=A0A1I6JPI5_9FIRM|nr:ABC transporter ATP-binding protein [Anaeromicropila populeti]SFR80811.1 ATP-binding cassette, subfamily B [Anaeromicropila populeti]
MCSDRKEKLTVRRLLSNITFVLKYAMKLDKWLVVLVFSAFTICGLVYALFDSLFLKMFIEILSDTNKNLRESLIFVLIGMIFVEIGEIVQLLTDNYARARFVKIAGSIQADFIKKAADIDLICYDQNKYFDDFVIAASQAEEMIINGVMSTARIIGTMTTILALGALIMTINPLIAIFPVAGFFINMITRFQITKLEYEYEIVRKKVMRKADYSKRVFYQPEYAKEIKLSNIEIPLRKQFEAAIDEITDEARIAGRKIAILSLINWIVVFTMFSFFFVPMYLGYLALVKMSIGLSDAAAMNNAQGEVRNNLDGLNYALVDFQKVGQFAERFRRFIEYEIKIEKAAGSKKIPEEKAVLEIKNMFFRYDGADKDTLRNISMAIKPGERVAIVGENGAGKTTFIKLLMRLYDVTSGSICYGGEDIRNFATEEYRNIFGTVFQDYQLYGISLADNVKMDCANEQDRTIIEKALEKADFTEKLNRLPKGIDTEMTREFNEEGTMLSGGEAQKVAISRMFAKTNQMSIAILDEPSSALDPFAEHTLTKNMMECAKDAAVIFISHRLSTTRDADRIYMFENGEIIEEGTHDELMKLDGKYKRMFEKQAHYYKNSIL